MYFWALASADDGKRKKIPLLLYNFPANAGGQDMPSAVISKIMNKAPNLCGVKLT